MNFRRLLCIPVTCLVLVTGCEVPQPQLSIGELVARGQEGDAAAVVELVERVDSNTPLAQRAEAYKFLLTTRLGEEAIRKNFEDPDPVRREQALTVGAARKVPGIFDAAVKAIADANFSRSNAAAWTLGELGDVRAVPILFSALVRGAPDLTAREAARSLGRLGDNSAHILSTRMGELKGASLGYGLRVLGELRVEGTKQTLVTALEDPATRLDAVWALGTMGKVGVPVDLTQYLDDPDWLVRVEACRAVGLLSDKSAEPLLDRLRREDPDLSVREWAARGMALVTGEQESYLDENGEWKTPKGLYH